MRVVQAIAVAVLPILAAMPATLSAQVTPAAQERDPDNALTYEAIKAKGGTVPGVIVDAQPSMPAKAVRDKISGKVSLEAVVLTDGLPAHIRVTKALDPEIDEVCIAALRKWRFTPGRLNGEAVPVIITVDMTFSVR